jgi:hypothetical protein
MMMMNMEPGRASSNLYLRKFDVPQEESATTNILKQSHIDLMSSYIERHELLDEMKEAKEGKQLLQMAQFGDVGAVEQVRKRCAETKIEMKNGSFAYVAGFIAVTIFSNGINLAYAFASGNLRYYLNVLSYATMPLSWTCGWMHMFSTIEHSDISIIIFHTHCIVTLMGIAYIIEACFNGLYVGIGGTLIVFLFWYALYYTFRYLFTLRWFISKKYAASIGSTASNYMFQGTTILIAQSYLACDSIGSCIFTQSYPPLICGEYARGNCVVGWQLLLGWSMSLMLFDTMALSKYKVLTLRFSRGQWISGVSFGVCVILAMFAFATKASGVPLTVSVGWCFFGTISMTTAAFSVTLVHKKQTMSEYGGDHDDGQQDIITSTATGGTKL